MIHDCSKNYLALKSRNKIPLVRLREAGWVGSWSVRGVYVVWEGGRRRSVEVNVQHSLSANTSSWRCHQRGGGG